MGIVPGQGIRPQGRFITQEEAHPALQAEMGPKEEVHLGNAPPSNILNGWIWGWHWWWGPWGFWGPGFIAGFYDID